MVVVQSLLSAAIATPEVPLSGLALLDQAAKTQIVEAFNATDAAFAKDATLHSLFEEQAAVHPTRPCIIGAEHVYTYKQVEDHANQARPYLQLSVPWDRREGEGEGG